jgi:hypothetical protein
MPRGIDWTRPESRSSRRTFTVCYSIGICIVGFWMIVASIALSLVYAIGWKCAVLMGGWEAIPLPPDPLILHADAGAAVPLLFIGFFAVAVFAQICIWIWSSAPYIARIGGWEEGDRNRNTAN